MMEAADPTGFVTRTGRAAEMGFVRMGLLNCFISHIHIMPSFENDVMLFAICVPITLRELTGYLCAYAEIPDLWTAIDLTLISHNKSCPL